MDTETKIRQHYDDEPAPRQTLADQQQSHTDALARLGTRVSDLEEIVAKLHSLVEELRRETGLQT